MFTEQIQLPVSLRTKVETKKWC